MSKIAKPVFNQLKNVFQNVFVLMHFNLALLIRFKTDASNFDVAEILFQLQKNKQ